MFILNESTMNGTVTLDTNTTIVMTEDFTIAKEKIIHSLDINCPCYTINEDNDSIFSYTIGGQSFPVVGVMKNIDVQVIR